LQPKGTIIAAFEEKLPVVQNSKKYLKKDAIIQLHIEKYKDHLAKYRNNPDSEV